MAGNGAAREIDADFVEVVQFAGSAVDAGTRNVHQHAANLRRAPRDRSDLIDIVRAGRAGIDPARHAILQAQRRPLFGPASMAVNVDQPRRDDLAARIDHVGSVHGNVGFHGDDPAAGDRDIANRIEPDRRIDDASSPDDQLVALRQHMRDTRKHRGARNRGGGGNKSTTAHHDRDLPLLILQNGNIFCLC